MLVTEITQLLNTSLAEGFQSFCELIASKSLGQVINELPAYIRTHKLEEDTFKIAKTIPVQAQNLQHLLSHLYSRNTFYEITRTPSQCLSLKPVFNNLIKIAGQACVSTAISRIDHATTKFYYSYLQTFESEQDIGLTAENVSTVFTLLEQNFNYLSSTLYAHLLVIFAKLTHQPELLKQGHIAFILQLLTHTTDYKQRTSLFNLIAPLYRKLNAPSKCCINYLFLLVNQEKITDLKIRWIDALAYYLYLAKTQIEEKYPLYHQQLCDAQHLAQLQLDKALQSYENTPREKQLKERLILINNKLSQLLTIWTTLFHQAQINPQAEKLWKEHISNQ